MTNFIKKLSKGSYFEVGSENKKNIYRIMKVYKNTIHISSINEPLSINIRKLKQFEETYTQEIYNFCMINKDDGDSIFLIKIQERINFLVELEKDFDKLGQSLPFFMRVKRKKLINLKKLLTKNC